MAPVPQLQPETGSFPAPAQIAFALVVLKSKPARASVEDYLGRLRAHIVNGSVSNARPTSQHLDAAGYWKEALEKVEMEKAALLDKLRDLEMQRAAANSPSSPTATSHLTKDEKSRREDTPAAKANSRSKRRANTSKAVLSPAADDDYLECNEVLPAGRVTSEAARLLQTFFDMRMQLRTQPPALPAVLAAARRLCHTIFESISSIRMSNDQGKKHSDGQAGVWWAIKRTYNTLLEAIELCSTHSPYAGGTKALISELAKILAEMLKCLQAMAMREQPIRCGLRTRAQSREGDKQILELTNLIASMMTDLDLTKVAQLDLFDGLLCTFLEHLGAKLSLAVFAGQMAQGFSQPCGLLQPPGLSAEMAGQAPADLSATLQVAPYLIAILRKTKSCLEKRGNLDSSGFAGAVVDKMQNTLLRGLFGDHEQAFTDSLSRPAKVEGTDNTEDVIADSVEEITSEWFIGEIWNNVGWDILTKHIN